MYTGMWITEIIFKYLLWLIVIKSWKYSEITCNYKNNGFNGYTSDPSKGNDTKEFLLKADEQTQTLHKQDKKQQ
jgi:hypothetical protein